MPWRATLRAWLLRRRYALLFGLLLATIAIGPIAAELGFGRVLEVLLGLSLLATAVPVQAAGQRRVLLAIIVLAVVLRYAPLRSVLGDTQALSFVLWGAIALYAAYQALRYALTSVPVDGDHLIAALSAYLLVGVFWGAIYVAVEERLPGSLLAAGARFPNGMTLSDGIYFSFVTLATLGYGDITPVTPISRGLAVFEAIAGQFYLAVLVARLVGLRAASEVGDGTR
jgi:voltage-gated potassium channel